MLRTLWNAHAMQAMVPLDKEFKLDIHWWLENITGWNGISYMVFDEANHTIALDTSTDGGEDGGPGVRAFNFISNEWFRSSILEECHNWHISDLELLAHILCMRLWVSKWSGMCIKGLTDSKPSEMMLWNGRSRIHCRLQMARLITSM